jgi:peptidoglycan/LPS O-acetylase OafA/YrhL
MSTAIDVRLGPIPGAAPPVDGPPSYRHPPTRPETPMPRQCRPDIQGLRAIAVLLVVLYHVGVPSITGGYVGVDVFFVISGFLITGQLVREVQRTGRISFLSFYAGRIRRLLPAATVVALVTLAAARLWGSVFQIQSTGWDAILTALYGINYRLAGKGISYQQAAGPESPLQHFWSLAVEEQFYVLWPLVIALCVLAGRRHLRGLLAAVLVVACALSLYLSVTVTASNAPLAYFSIQTRAWELGAGAVIALLAGRLARLPGWASAPLSWLGLAAIVWSGLVYTDETPFPGSAALVPVLGTVTVIAAGCHQARHSAELILGLRPMQGIGKVSYSWYLWHWPLITMVPLIFDRTFSWWEKAELGVLGLWLAVLTYWIVESPTRHTRLRRPAWLGVGILLSTAVAAMGTVLVITVPALVGGGVAARPLNLAGADVNAVKQAVAAGTSTVAVPINLQPSLATVSDDRPLTSRNGCHLALLAVDQGPCVFGDPEGQRTMVLVGDSHAQQWFPALDAAAREYHWRLVSWTKAACSIANYVPYRPQLHRTFTECVIWRDRTIERIVAMQPDLVVFGQADAVPGNGITNIDWAEKTVSTVRRVQAASIPVAYLMDTPYPRINVPECAAQHLDNVGVCTAKRDRVWPYPGRHEMLTQTLGAAGVTTIEPIDWFCTMTDCPPTVGNLLVYRDTDHMSTAYSAWLAPMLAPLFRTP